jgi:hypothetical protein
MEDDTEQTGQGGMTDDLMSRGREAAGQAMNDPETRDRVTGQVQDRFGNLPGTNQAAQAVGTKGGAASEQDTGSEPTAEYDIGGNVSPPDDQETSDTESSP